jgi:hypothetical protein
MITSATKPLTDPSCRSPISRSRLLLAVIRAASAHSVGTDDSQAQRQLDGKRFEVRLRFGCDGQGPRGEDHGWSVDPDGRTLRLRVVQTLSLEDEPVRSLAGDRVEAVEGFWLSHPWMLDANCPADQPATEPDREQPEGPADQGEAIPSPPKGPAQQIGIAQFFTAEDSRARRRAERPFEAVKQLQEGESVGRQGFNLVLSGRLQARENGRVILCAGSGRDRPPDCVVSADIDRVWIERPEDQAVIAQWSS